MVALGTVFITLWTHWGFLRVQSTPSITVSNIMMLSLGRHTKDILTIDVEDPSPPNGVTNEPRNKETQDAAPWISCKLHKNIDNQMSRSSNSDNINRTWCHKSQQETPLIERSPCCPQLVAWRKVHSLEKYQDLIPHLRAPGTLIREEWDDSPSRDPSQLSWPSGGRRWHWQQRVTGE